MKITIAKTAGFCMGVRRAVDLALDAPGRHPEPIYTFGPLIHNPQILHLFEEKGVRVLREIPAKGQGTVIIRAHGVPPQEKEALKSAGFEVIDATCPRVIRVQTIIRVHAKKGYAAIIIGDADHPEVVGLLGYADGNGHVAATLEALDQLPAFENAIIVAQTTQNTRFFETVKEWAARHHPHYKIFETICGSTEKRQEEVRVLADAVDSVVVVGGKNSGNTQRLAEIVHDAGKPVYHIETESELNAAPLRNCQHVGLTAGASTPNWIIRRVYRKLESIPLTHGRPWSSFTFALQRFLLLTNIYVAVGAGCLCFASMRLQGLEIRFPEIFVAVLYVLSMHILNHLTGKEENRFNDPDRALFYEKNKLPLVVLALSAGAAGLLAAFFMGFLPFICLLGMSILGLSYNLRILPPPGPRTGKLYRLRDIPGSKTILIALAWGVVTTLLPALAEIAQISINTVVVFVWSTAIVLVRSAFFDILDMQGDRIVGKETISTLLGEARSIVLMKTMLTLVALLIGAAAAFQIIPGLGYALMLCPVFVLIVLFFHEKGYMVPGIRMEFLVESVFILAGVFSLFEGIVKL